MRQQRCWARLSLFSFMLGMLKGMEAQTGPGPVLSSQTVAILGDELYVHGGSKSDGFLESGCISDIWRLRLGQFHAWNLTEATWESVPLKNHAIDLPPVSGIGLRSLTIPRNQTLNNNNTLSAENISPYLIEFGRAGCADDADKDTTETPAEGEEAAQPSATPSSQLPWIGFNMYNPIMNTWQSIDLVNATEDLGFNKTTALVLGNWMAPVVAVDNSKLAWFIILQSSAPLRQVILRKDLATLNSFMGRIDLQESSSTLFPTSFLLQGWTLVSILEENAPFVGQGVATVVGDEIVIISGTANSFTPGDADQGELRGCDHAYVFSTVTSTWSRRELTVANNGPLPDTREKAAFLAIDNKIYMHGGVKPYQHVLNDLWILDTDRWVWTRGPDGPGPRADHTLLQYHEYILGVSGFDMGRNVPLTSVLPILAYNTNQSTWTHHIRATIDDESTYISNITRTAIIIGTVVFGFVLLVIAGSTRCLRKWNQRNYTKVNDEMFQLEEQRRRAAQDLPSILKKKYQSESGDSKGAGAHFMRTPKGLQSEIIFEDSEEDYEAEDEDEDDRDSFEEEGDHSVGLLSKAQANPTTSGRRPLQAQPRAQQGLAREQSRRVRIQEEATFVAEDEHDLESDEDDEEEDEDGQVIVRLPGDLGRREE
ncbi:hypothetical protein EMPS_02311 [Entomortierella parvispora]|uniref:Galactose oxidase n=1 Tax=Entomortierella parvispora TaxID=205924 RepID=A0A9P3H571_9FUNG|nr:hypothetical protein EMPS_02311 [Entomortierella parvispora]